MPMSSPQMMRMLGFPLGMVAPWMESAQVKSVGVESGEQNVLQAGT